MISIGRSISTRILVPLFCLEAFLIASGFSQVPVTPTPTVKVINDSLVVVMDKQPISLAVDRNLMLEDITPCQAATQISPAYSCPRAERDGSQLSLRTIYPPRSCSQTQGQQGSETWVQVSCKDPGSKFEVVGKVPTHVNQNRNLIISSNMPTFSGGRLYRLTYWTQAKDKSATLTVTANEVTIDTRAVISVNIPAAFNKTAEFIFNAPVAFSQDQVLLKSDLTNCPRVFPADGWRPITLRASGKGDGLKGQVRMATQFGSIDQSTPSQLLAELANFGEIVLCVNSGAVSSQFSPAPSAASDVISASGTENGKGPVIGSLVPGGCAGATKAAQCADSAWSFSNGVKLVVQSSQPTGKSDSGFYANLNLVAGTGAKFAWGLDGKLAEQQRKLIGNSSITWLSATANVGNNTSNIKGQTYGDSVDWTLPISYDWRKLTFVLAPDYSTDIEFDRKNMLADIHVMLTEHFHRLAWNTALESGADAKYSSTSIKPGTAYQLYFEGGVEAGGALINTIQKASSGKASVTVPAYDIARAVPQIHYILEWKPIKGAGVGVLTFDETVTGRYLLTTENTVAQYSIPAVGSTPTTVGLLLRPISGWKGYNSFVTTWYPPHSANAGLGITYNDGFNSPKFTRIDSVTIGLTVLF